ncbi:sugar phosphorylase [Clostridium thermarum]|uniref:sugar phosphorylase n=1 Tax=Clostridium thermarum TaxID=1716543 RepID=UPI00112089D5|nr:sugar phosphorylase [Clostridium thermarum]
MKDFHVKSLELLKVIYKDETLKNAENIISSLIDKWENYKDIKNIKLNEKDAMLITYGDGIISDKEKPLRTLKKFLDENCQEEVTDVHLLPICPSTSDDGFSVSDYKTVDECLGDWEDIKALSNNYGLMIDAVVNHSSKSHAWFKACLDCVEEYKDYYIEADPDADYSMVTRPRALPLLTKFKTKEGEKFYWTTFSDDQIDLNFSNPVVLAEMIEVLLFYAQKGAKFIRLDAIGFAFKKLGTTCMHLEETHAIVKLMRLFLQEFFPSTYIITETNVPHLDNISYFGDGDEAHLVYQFPLPPLTMFSLQKGDTSKLTQWAKSLEDTPLKEGNTYFNFLASHDGVGVRPIEGILTEEEKNFLIDNVLKNGGRVSYRTNTDGSKSPYELNISYLNGITSPEKDNNEKFQRFMASQGIMLSMQGVPGIYYHSLLGSENWYEGVEASGINRRINREKLHYDKLTAEIKDETSLRHMVFTRYKELLKIRGSHSAFSPYASQKVLELSPSLFAVERYNESTDERIIAIVNVTDKNVKLKEPIVGRDLLASGQIEEVTDLKPYQIAWILL